MAAYKSYMMPFTAIIDIPNDAAAIPGDGDAPVSLTHTTDVGKYVAALLDVPRWESETYISGDKVTMNQFLEVVEMAKGIWNTSLI